MKRQHPTDPNLFWCPKCKEYHDQKRFYKNYYGGKTPGVCKMWQAKYDSSYHTSHYYANRDKVLNRAKEYAKTKAGKKAHKRGNEAMVRNLSICYIKGLLKQAEIAISENMMELVRQRIIMKRTLKQFKQWRKEQENESNHTDVHGKQFTDEENHEGRV